MSPHDPTGLDARARDIHEESLGHLSPRVQAQLALRRREALAGTARRVPRGLAPWTGVATAGLALALVLQLRPPSPDAVQAAATPGSAPAPHVLDTNAAPRLAMADSDAIIPDLSEDPEFYLWLGDRQAGTE